MGPLLVPDTSIIIDLVRGEVLEAAFRTRFSLVVPDVLYERELAAHGGPALTNLGLQVHALDGEGVGLAERFLQSTRGLSLVDAFALALAKHLDAMEEEGVLSRRSLQTALERVTAHPRCRLPREEVRRRLQRYERG